MSKFETDPAPVPRNGTGVSFGNCENRTKGENGLVIRTKQVHYMYSLPEMVQIFKSLCPAFQAFCHAKVAMLKLISRNRRENEHHINA
ncbi:hypothetical protein N9M78_02765 [Alphaproteobacteria bacterium]|nr:hypothetical protein [Alphaproteobacteria bacterium]